MLIHAGIICVALTPILQELHVFLQDVVESEQQVQLLDSPVTLLLVLLTFIASLFFAELACEGKDHAGEIEIYYKEDPSGDYGFDQKQTLAVWLALIFFVLAFEFFVDADQKDYQNVDQNFKKSVAVQSIVPGSGDIEVTFACEPALDYIHKVDKPVEPS